MRCVCRCIGTKRARFSGMFSRRRIRRSYSSYTGNVNGFSRNADGRNFTFDRGHRWAARNETFRAHASDGPWRRPVDDPYSGRGVRSFRPNARIIGKKNSNAEKRNTIARRSIIIMFRRRRREYYFASGSTEFGGPANGWFRPFIYPTYMYTPSVGFRRAVVSLSFFKRRVDVLFSLTYVSTRPFKRPSVRSTVSARMCVCVCVNRSRIRVAHELTFLR